MIRISEIAARYPRLFLSHLPFGVECGDGWADIIYAFFATVEEVVAAEGGTFHLLQIKEKLGALRIYFRTTEIPNRGVAAIDRAYGLAEARSFHICEHCGRRGCLTYNGMMYATRCGEHAEELESQPVLPTPRITIVTAARAVLYDPDADPFVAMRSI
ncbi:hypothetical protein [Neorhizobium galegae]|uniref:hypothetical protein n=1 Tax=Neorhizobium galegae TaxID=399 RepID=UPI001F1C973B|nr:hypothetical protein [Neorhizobium galegae]UIK06595.1 hypothetical protein LZK81_06360 [Neorhizobium galegae]